MSVPSDYNASCSKTIIVRKPCITTRIMNWSSSNKISKSKRNSSPAPVVLLASYRVARITTCQKSSSKCLCHHGQILII